MEASWEDQAPASPEPGWYPYYNGQRFWDGAGWTLHFAPPPPSAGRPIISQTIALSTMVGVLLALGIVWLGAQVSPDHAYLPVKFVVKNLPHVNGLGY